MGFLRNLKELFNKNIECGNEIDDRIVYFLKKKKYLYLNKNIYVREKNACVIVYKGRVCDVIFPGKYRFNADSIPETYERAKIERRASQGYVIRKIRADIYFVNLNEFNNFEYSSKEPFKTKSNAVGKVKGCLYGTCKLKVLDAGQLLKFLISNKGRVSNSEIKQMLSLVVGNKINNIVKKNKIPTDMLFNNQEGVENIVNTDMQDALDKVGLFASNIKLKKINFDKKNHNKVNKFLTDNRSLKPNVASVKSILNVKDGNDRSTVTVGVSKPISSMQTPNKPVDFQRFCKCSVCKKNNPIGAKICTNCGNKLN